MNFGVTSRLISTTFALCGFAVAILAGLSAGNDSSRVLTTALIAMVACQGAGLVVGSIGERIVGEHMRSYRSAHPIGAAGAEKAGGKTSPPDPQNS